MQVEQHYGGLTEYQSAPLAYVNIENELYTVVQPHLISRLCHLSFDTAGLWIIYILPVKKCCQAKCSEEDICALYYCIQAIYDMVCYDLVQCDGRVLCQFAV